MECSWNPPRTQLIPTHPLNLSTHLLLCWTHPTPKRLFSLKNFQEPPKWHSLRAYFPTIHFLHSNQSDLLRKMGHTIPLLESFPELPTKFRIQPKFLTRLTQALYDLAPPIYLTYLLPVSSSLSLYAAITLASFMFIKCIKVTHTSGPFPLLFPLSGKCSLQISGWLAFSWPFRSQCHFFSQTILHQLV